MYNRHTELLIAIIRSDAPDLIDRFAADIRSHHEHVGKFVTTDHRNNNPGLKLSGSTPDRSPLWQDAAGGTVAAPVAPPHACVHEALAESGLRVTLVCEEGFRDRPEFLDAVCACVVSGLERQRLDAAHGMDVKASEAMLRVGEILWPGQYKPH